MILAKRPHREQQGEGDDRGRFEECDAREVNGTLRVDGPAEAPRAFGPPPKAPASLHPSLSPVVLRMSGTAPGASLSEAAIEASPEALGTLQTGRPAPKGDSSLIREAVSELGMSSRTTTSVSTLSRAAGSWGIIR